MANQLSIAEQVAALTPEQRNKIPRIGKIAMIVQLVVAIPLLVLELFGLIYMLTNPLDVTDAFFGGFLTVFALAFLWVVGVLLFVKIKYPYYSDAKAKYIKKQQKAQRKC